IERLRLTPLILRSPLDELVQRRKRVFDTATPYREPYGYAIAFQRTLKRSRRHPQGRACEGVFHLLSVSDTLVVIASALSGLDQRHGPTRFAEKAYPLARRPFFPSTMLVRLLEEYAQRHQWTVIARDTWGYHRRSGKFRRDFEPQAPRQAALEMAEQGRQVHRIAATYRARRRERYRLSFDRNAGLVVERGDPSQPMQELLLPAISRAMASEKTFHIARATHSREQEVLELTFGDTPFDSHDAMRALCDAIRRSDGLNVAVIHLNPYLHAQILDFFTGAAIDLAITNNKTVSLVPRSGECSISIQRIAHTIFQHFAEAKATRGHIDR
ncbi:MAG: hypothetical protein JXA57_03405, partial [Armatimonadetes bacterium]|nr:hypothetical protein [Armatimonadota bacterium]